MKQQFYIFVAVFLFIGGIFSANAQDIIVLRDGNIIEARVTEISASEIRYKRFSHLDGPTIVISRNNVLSIRYENGTVEIINAAPASGQSGLQANQQAGSQASPQTGSSVEGSTPQLSQPTALQSILNYLPAIPIAGNNLKFEFGGESWVARVNGESFSAGTIKFEETEGGGILTLTQTHVWPGAVGRTAGRVANVIPGGGAVGGVLNTAGNVAGTVGPIESSGTIVLEYKAGPPASLRLISSSVQSGSSESGNARGSSSVSLKFSLGLVIGIFSWDNTQTYDNGYTNSFSGTYLNLIQPISSLRLLFSFENKLRLGLGVDASYSLVSVHVGGTGFGGDVSGILAPYGIIGYNNAYLHIGYDFALGALFIAPSFTVTEHFMINIPMSFLGNNHNFGIAKAIEPPDGYDRAGQHYTSISKMFLIGISFQYVFGKRNQTPQRTGGESAFNGNGSRYEVVNTPMTWEEARLEAERRGGYLAVITSSAENTYVRNLIRGGSANSYWLGGQADRSRNWSWVTGEPFRYTNWVEGNPDNNRGREDKIEMLRSVDWAANAVGQWNDTANSDSNGFVIEYPANSGTGDRE